MTRGLLVAVLDTPGGAGVQLLLLAVSLPVLPFLVALDALLWGARTIWTWWVLSREHARCPRSHVVELASGPWQCASCKLVHEGHGFAPCPHCGEVAYALACPCGLPVRNPLWRSDDA